VITFDAAQVRERVSMAAAIDAVRHAFVALARGEFDLPTRAVLGDGQFLVMPVHHRPSATAVVKTLSLNFDGREPAIAGTVTWSRLSDDRSVIADATTITCIRTGAVVGVATDLLAVPDADRCTLIGAGAQAPDQVRAVHAVRPLRELRIVSRTQHRAEALAAAMRAELPETEIVVLTDPEHAVDGVDIVSCATTATEPLFHSDALGETVHVNAIGSFRPTMRELPDELLAAARVVIDERGAALTEAGEIIHAIGAGALAEGDLVELGVALDGPAPEFGGRTVFKSVGVAVQDWAIGDLLAREP
jgi:ornithine cyclodeaminase/alanine dehydrogenase-like protein (mu-crystallin family)